MWIWFCALCIQSLISTLTFPAPRAPNICCQILQRLGGGTCRGRMSKPHMREHTCSASLYLTLNTTATYTSELVINLINLFITRLCSFGRWAILEHTLVLNHQSCVEISTDFRHGAMYKHKRVWFMKLSNSMKTSSDLSTVAESASAVWKQLLHTSHLCTCHMHMIRL